MSTRVAIPHSTVLDMHGKAADADFQIWVAPPVAGLVPFPSGARHVLYVLDANLFFGTAVETTRLMSQLYGELPPILVVGIAYATDSPSVQAELRARDFTPSTDRAFEAMAAGFPGAPAPTLPEGERFGRAAEFLTFLTEEVKPFIEARYDVSPDASVLFGSSLGGLFTLYALMRRSDAFRAYIAASPALWWDDALLLREEEDLAASRGDLEATLFLAVGSEEERSDIPTLAPFKMVSNVRCLGERLASRGYRSLDLTTYVAEGESHTTMVPQALTRGLRSIYRPRRRDEASSAGGSFTPRSSAPPSARS